MNGKERVKKSLDHIQPDKIPVDFGSNAVTGMHAKIVHELHQHFGMKNKTVKAYEPYQMLGLIEEDLMNELGIDVQGVVPRNTMFGFPNEKWKPWRMDDGLPVMVSDHFRTSKVEDGSQLIYPKGDTSAPPSGKMPKNGYFFDSIIRQDPINDSNLNVEDNLEEFDYLSEEDLEYFRTESEAASGSGRALMITIAGTAFGDIALVPAPFLKHPKGIRDIQEWYISTLTRQDYIHQIFSRQAEIALVNLERLNRIAGEHIDAIYICGTDFGTQNSQFCDEATYRSLYLPYYKKLNDWIHENTGWKTFKHSCGAVRNLIPTFIESGFDILNPVQLTAAGMDARDLKREFGSEITFWGGGVDTQHELMFGTPEEVRKQVLERCEIFGKDGGFIFNTVHNIQANTPVENVLAMFGALSEFNGR